MAAQLDDNEDAVVALQRRRVTAGTQILYLGIVTRFFTSQFLPIGSPLSLPCSVKSLDQ